MKEEIKELRVSIDMLAQLTKELKPIKQLGELIVIGHTGTQNEWVNKVIDVNSKEIEKAIDSFYLGKAWLGKLLGESGVTNPYGSGYKTKEDIVPTQDVAKNLIIDKDGGWEEFNHIEKVDWLRSKIEQLSLQILILPDYNEKSITKYNSYTHLCEARFWLGFEMARIREEK